MNKIWTYIVVFLTGVISGLVAMYYMAGDQIEIVVRKIKNKRTTGSNTVTIPVDVKKKRRKVRKIK